MVVATSLLHLPVSMQDPTFPLVLPSTALLDVKDPKVVLWLLDCPTREMAMASVSKILFRFIEKSKSSRGQQSFKSVFR